MPDAEASEEHQETSRDGLDALVEQVLAAPGELAERLAELVAGILGPLAPNLQAEFQRRLQLARAALSAADLAPEEADVPAPSGAAQGPGPAPPPAPPAPGGPAPGGDPGPASRHPEHPPQDPAALLFDFAEAARRRGAPLVLGYAEIQPSEAATPGGAGTGPQEGDGVRLLQRWVLSRLRPGDRGLVLSPMACGLVLTGVGLADAEARFADLPEHPAGTPGAVLLGLAAPLPGEPLRATFSRARRLARPSSLHQR